MRGKGINYDTGFSPGGRLSREEFDAGAKVEYVILNAGHNLLGSEHATQCQTLLVEFFTTYLQARPQVCSQRAL
jgi:hypothetical protein